MEPNTFCIKQVLSVAFTAAFQSYIHIIYTPGSGNSNVWTRFRDIYANRQGQVGPSIFRSAQVDCSIYGLLPRGVWASSLEYLRCACNANSVSHSNLATSRDQRSEFATCIYNHYDLRVKHFRIRRSMSQKLALDRLEGRRGCQATQKPRR